VKAPRRRRTTCRRSIDLIDSVALFRHLPQLRAVPWAVLGEWPTPIEPAPILSATIGGDVWIKREDRSSPHYGGNKVRTLEAVLGGARERGAARIWSTGAYGSNHAVATAIHAPRVGLSVGALAFPQPPTAPATANLRALLASATDVVRLRSWVEVPLAMMLAARAERRRDRAAFVMSPGGATVEGAFGGLSAAFEVADQIAAGVAPSPAQILLAVGSSCTTAGLLAGVHVAAELGIGWRRPPLVVAVRVTPWPVTAAWRIANLAARVVARVDRLRGRSTDIDVRRLRANLIVDGRYIGAGYGEPTAAGESAIAAFARAGAPPLDVVYSAKSAAALWYYARNRGPTLYWATKSSVPLPVPTADQLARAHPHMRRWLGESR
jgi:D-cysteine desulfhydrase